MISILKKKFTCLLLYPEHVNDSGCETYFTWVRADDVYGAIAAARKNALEANGYDFCLAEEFPCLLVLEGWHHALG